MNIAFINGSPKRKDSASGALLADLKQLIPSEHLIKEFNLNKDFITEKDIEALHNCSVWVFAFPLYVDSIPSHLLSCFCQLEQTEFNRNNIYVYGLVNCGFYEGEQTQYAMSMMEIWCDKVGLNWGMGVGFGGGGGLAQMKSIPLGKGPKKTLGKSLAVCADAISKGISIDNVYTSINLPRFVYKFFAESTWKKSIKANGGKVKDLNKKL